MEGEQPALQYPGNTFEGAVLGGRPEPPPDIGDGAHAMALAIGTPCTPLAERTKCDVLLLISSAAGYERRRKVIRATMLQALKASPALAARVSYRFLLGAPKPEQEAVLAAEQAEHCDLLQVSVPESYETLFPKIVASWRWAVATHDFGFWMHADDDSYVRFDLLLRWLDEAPAAQPHAGLYAGYIWDGSEGRRTKPLRDPTAKSYMPVEQWPHDSYPPFASVRPSTAAPSVCACMRACVRVHACMRARACVRACTCMYACVRVRACACACVHAGVPCRRRPLRVHAQPDPDGTRCVDAHRAVASCLRATSSTASSPCRPPSHSSA